MCKSLVVFTVWSMMCISCGEKDTDTATDEAAENTENTDSGTGFTEDTGMYTWEDNFDVCTFIGEESTQTALPATEIEAAQLVLVPDAGESYLLTKEVGAEGWFVLDVPSWMCDVELYTAEGVSMEIRQTADWELGDVGTPVSECEQTSLIRHSWTFHTWGSYVIHIEENDLTDIWMVARVVLPM